MIPAYAELQCRSNFSFLTGASHPEELVARAAELGYAALAVTDECSVAGAVRAHEEAKRQQEAGRSIRLVHGSEFRLTPDAALPQGLSLVVLVHNREGWGDLCETITLARSQAPKGRYRLQAHQIGMLPQASILWVPARDQDDAALLHQAQWCMRQFPGRVSLAAHRFLWADDGPWLERLQQLADAVHLPIAACGDVRMHRRSRKPLQDTLTAIRLRRRLQDCGLALAPNAEQHLRSRLQLATLFPPEWLAHTVEIAERCQFDLGQLRYEYPAELVPAGLTPILHLRNLVRDGAHARCPAGLPPGVQAQIERELRLIEDLHYEPFFLTVHDVVRFARNRNILCQGRGSAANSVVCWCLGITEVDPTQTTLLFERFISRERAEPPDIDVDFEHERREEVIQYIYEKYGEHRCALAAAVTAYRTRGAVRDVGFALGQDPQAIDGLARSVHWFDDTERLDRSLIDLGLDPASADIRRWLELVRTIQRFPRHLSQHTGGFVIAAGKLSRLVPIEPASMEKRRVIQWDKDDLESLGLLKVDVLALGMLTVLRKALQAMTQWHAWCPASASQGPALRRRDETRPWALQDIPQGDAATFEMACRADTVGVFQIESRAQQSMLPRLKPQVFYDLVIQVAIVRPGPIQGGMVHPYLERRAQRAAGALPPPRYPALEAALGRTLGVPIFQEQVMQICIIAAGFTPGEADNLRRSMAAWRKKGEIHRFHERIVQGMADRGYDREFAEGIFRQIEGFGEYGFPESHAYSFAILAYFSAWLKCHEPEAFLLALLNSQPMGFYSPSQLVQDARRHSVEVRPADVSFSDWDCTLEPTAGRPAVRLGLRLVAGLSAAVVERLVDARCHAPWRDVQDMANRAALTPSILQRLARADALSSVAGHRRQQLWAASGTQAHRATNASSAALQPDLFAHHPVPESCTPDLFETPEGESVTLDYATLGLSLRSHPLALLRERLRRRGWRSSQELHHLADGRQTWACGLVTMRQQPVTAKGTTFVTLEDEAGSVNIIVWKAVREAHRPALLGARLLAVSGQWQHRNGVQHLVARRLLDVSPWLGELAQGTSSRDFR